MKVGRDEGEASRGMSEAAVPWYNSMVNVHIASKGMRNHSQIGR